MSPSEADPPVIMQSPPITQSPPIMQSPPIKERSAPPDRPEAPPARVDPEDWASSDGDADDDRYLRDRPPHWEWRRGE